MSWSVNDQQNKDFTDKGTDDKTPVPVLDQQIPAENEEDRNIQQELPFNGDNIENTQLPENETNSNADNSTNAPSSQDTQLIQMDVSPDEQQTQQVEQQTEPEPHNISGNLDNNFNSFGEAFKAYRERAHFSITDLAKTLCMLPSHIENLEKENFYAFENTSFIIINLRSISNKLKLDGAEKEELQNLLEKALRDSGIDDCESDDEDNQMSPFSVKNRLDDKGEKHTPIMTKLPGIIISTLMLAILLLILAAVIVKLINKSSHNKAKKMDLAPLIVPKEPQPLIFQIPES